MVTDPTSLRRTCFDCERDIPPTMVCDDCWSVRYLADGEKALVILCAEYRRRFPDEQIDGDKRKAAENKDAF